MKSIWKWYKKWFKGSSWSAQAMVLCWLALLLLCPLSIISAFHEHDPYGLSISLGLTMFVYWATGIFTALIKGWKLDNK